LVLRQEHRAARRCSWTTPGHHSIHNPEAAGAPPPCSGGAGAATPCRGRPGRTCGTGSVRIRPESSSVAWPDVSQIT
jgi:hypothetical protein